MEQNKTVKSILFPSFFLFFFLFLLFAFCACFLFHFILPYLIHLFTLTNICIDESLSSYPHTLAQFTFCYPHTVQQAQQQVITTAKTTETKNNNNNKKNNKKKNKNKKLQLVIKFLSVSRFHASSFLFFFQLKNTV